MASTKTVVAQHRTLDAQQVIDSIRKAIPNKTRPLHLVGPTGAGKSGLLSSVVGIMNEEKPGSARLVVMTDAASAEASDYAGIPFLSPAGNTHRLAPNERWVHELTQHENETIIVFIDEINRASVSVQNVLFPFFHPVNGERWLGNFKVTAPILIVTASNPSGGGYTGTSEVDVAFAARMTTFVFKPDVGQWINWASMHGVLPWVVGYIKSNPTALLGSELECKQHAEGDPTLGAPNPRAWEAVSDVIKAYGLTDLCWEHIAAIVGDSQASTFRVYVDNNSRIVDPNDFLEGRVAYPEQLSAQILLILGCISVATNDISKVKSLIDNLMPHVSPEIYKALLMVPLVGENGNGLCTKAIAKGFVKASEYTKHPVFQSVLRNKSAMDNATHAVFS